jgi:hypothetical protein
MRKLITVAAMVAAAIGTSLGMAASASAATASAVTGTTTCSTGPDSNISGTITTNLDVPAGATCRYFGGEVLGNASVEGNLVVAGVKFDRNVGVSGGSLSAINQGITISGNLSITNSPGAPDNGTNGFYNDAGTSYVGGNFSYTYNSGRLYVGLNNGYGTTVHGNFLFANNTGGYDIGGLTVNGTKTIS